MFGLPNDELIVNRTMTAEVIFNLSDKYPPETEVSFRVKILLNKQHYLSSIFVLNGRGHYSQKPLISHSPFFDENKQKQFSVFTADLC